MSEAAEDGRGEGRVERAARRRSRGYARCRMPQASSPMELTARRARHGHGGGGFCELAARFADMLFGYVSPYDRGGRYQGVKRRPHKLGGR